jgi:phytoene desaturase
LKQLIVIGAGQGGLSAAIYAKLKGWDVLVLEGREQSGGKAGGIVQGDYLLDPGPSIIILPRLYEAVFAAAGRKMSDYLVFDKLPTISRIYFEGSPPLDLPGTREECLRTLKEIAPQDYRGIQDLLRKLGSVAPLVDKTVFSRPYLTSKDMLDPGLLQFGLRFNPLRNYRQMVDRWVTSPLLRAFFYGFPSYGGQTWNSKAPGAFLIPYYMIEDGVYFPRGGVRAIPAAFEKLAKELGVEFRYNSKVNEVLGNESKATGVRLTTGEVISAHAVVSNADKLSLLTPRDGDPGWEPSFSYFTCHWGISKTIQGLDHHVLVIPKNFETGFEELYDKRTFPTNPIVYLNAVGALDPLAQPPGKTLLFSVVTAPAEVKGIHWEESKWNYVKSVKSELRSAGIEWCEDDEEFQRIQTPSTFAQRDGNYRGSLYGPDEPHRLMGLFPLGNRDAKWDNLTFCGGSVQPGAGLPMVTLSGKFAVDLLSTR